MSGEQCDCLQEISAVSHKLDRVGGQVSSMTHEVARLSRSVHGDGNGAAGLVTQMALLQLSLDNHIENATKSQSSKVVWFGQGLQLLSIAIFALLSLISLAISLHGLPG